MVTDMIVLFWRGQSIEITSILAVSVLVVLVLVLVWLAEGSMVVRTLKRS